MDSNNRDRCFFTYKFEMIKIITLLICLSFCSACKSQNSLITRKGALIAAPQFYSEKGVIIKNEPFFLTSKLNYKSLYSPTDSDLVSAEKLLSENFIGLSNKLNGNHVFDQTKDKGFYKEWYRQYFAYTNSDNDRMILIGLLKCCRGIKKCYPDWQDQIALLLDEDPCTKDARYLVNLSKNTISIL